LFFHTATCFHLFISTTITGTGLLEVHLLLLFHSLSIQSFLDRSNKYFERPPNKISNTRTEPSKSKPYYTILQHALHTLPLHRTSRRSPPIRSIRSSPITRPLTDPHHEYESTRNHCCNHCPNIRSCRVTSRSSRNVKRFQSKL